MARAGESAVAIRRRIALVGCSTTDMIRLRGGLIRALAAAGHSVRCYVGDGDQADQAACAELAQVGADSQTYPLMPQAGVPFADRRSLKALVRSFSEWHPHVVIGYGLKPMPLAAIAARRCAVQRIICLASSPWAAGADGGHRSAWPQRSLLERGIKASHAVVFHNREAVAACAEQGWLSDDQTIHVVAGGGVDLAHFAVQPLPPMSSGLCFTMIARKQRSKGVLEFCHAARRVRASSGSVRFVLAGPSAAGPQALSADDLAIFSGDVEIVGELSDVRPMLAACHVAVLPSHGEGMSRILMEALATGRPVVASDVPGCRDLVDERVNGALAPPGDANALAARIEGLIRHPELIAPMAAASRSKAERRFDAIAINRQLIDILGLAPSAP